MYNSKVQLVATGQSLNNVIWIAKNVYTQTKSEATNNNIVLLSTSASE